MGDGLKKPSKSEDANLGVARKSIVASKNIKAGEKFTEENHSREETWHRFMPDAMG